VCDRFRINSSTCNLHKGLETGHIPADWKDDILTALYKAKGSKTECGNYRPITLLSVSGKGLLHMSP